MSSDSQEEEQPRGEITATTIPTDESRDHVVNKHPPKISIPTKRKDIFSPDYSATATTPALSFQHVTSHRVNERELAAQHVTPSTVASSIPPSSRTPEHHSSQDTSFDESLVNPPPEMWHLLVARGSPYQYPPGVARPYSAVVQRNTPPHTPYGPNHSMHSVVALAAEINSSFPQALLSQPTPPRPIPPSSSTSTSTPKKSRKSRTPMPNLSKFYSPMSHHPIQEFVTRTEHEEIDLRLLPSHVRPGADEVLMWGDGYSRKGEEDKKQGRGGI